MADAEPTNAEADPLLVEFLRTRGGKCPRCEYELHGLQDGLCPECGCAPRLTVEAADTGMREFLWGLAPLVGVAGFYNGMALLFFFASVGVGPGAPMWTWQYAVVVAIGALTTGLTVAWIRWRRRIRSASPNHRRTLAALAWLTGAMLFVIPTSLFG